MNVDTYTNLNFTSTTLFLNEINSLKTALQLLSTTSTYMEVYDMNMSFDITRRWETLQDVLKNINILVESSENCSSKLNFYVTKYLLKIKQNILMLEKDFNLYAHYNETHVGIIIQNIDDVLRRPLGILSIDDMQMFMKIMYRISVFNTTKMFFFDEPDAQTQKINHEFSKIATTTNLENMLLHLYAENVPPITKSIDYY